MMFHCRSDNRAIYRIAVNVGKSGNSRGNRRSQLQQNDARAISGQFKPLREVVVLYTEATFLNQNGYLQTRNTGYGELLGLF